MTSQVEGSTKRLKTKAKFIMVNGLKVVTMNCVKGNHRCCAGALGKCECECHK